MISVACSNCGMKLQVRYEFAGRSGPCPTCKQVLEVPQPASPLTVPVGPIDVAPSSLDQAGSEVAATVILPASPGDRAEQHSVEQLLARSSSTGGRYLIEREIARGGMGAVVRAIDRDIRREVAIKYMLRAGDAGQKTRFVEEAQITGQLEHPNIVPIHEVGVDGERRLFFAMKMVKGRSLAQVLDDLRKRSAVAEFTWPLGKLLNVFTGVCYAVSYAHSRSVIHRDLKPANIMLGDFGETYVMDWGLAKVVVGGPSSPPEHGEFKFGGDGAAGSSAVGGSIQASSRASVGHVATNREMHGELTQEGAVLGTPAYMSPEQARGEVQRLDQRSDIYALGAILYELLTLLPPVETGGGAMELLARVAAGKVTPPEIRTPERARAGKIPKELSAVAMKALALQPGARYQTVESLRRDIELYQLGRAVSAKADTAWESGVKFVRRNKAVSIAACLLATVLAAAVVVNYQARVAADAARRKAEDNFFAFEQEQQAKNDAIRKSIPGTLRIARQLADEGALREALEQIALVRIHQPNNAESYLLTGQIALAEKRWPAAVADFDVYLRHKPDDTEVLKLRSVAMTGRTDDLRLLIYTADALQRQRLFGLAQPLLREIAAKVADREPVLEMCRKQIHATHPDAGIDMGGDGRIAVQFRTVNRPKRLDFLRGLPINALDLPGCSEVVDLEPLRGMPLDFLSLASTGVRDLEPLRGMPLRNLDISHTQVSDLSPLTGMPLVDLNADNCPNVESFEGLRGAPLERLKISNGRVADLEPLRGAPLKHLTLSRTSIRDLGPLAGMPLKELDISQTSVDDLEPLRGIKLESLMMNTTRVKDLGPIACDSLKILRMDLGSVTDVTPIASLPLKQLTFDPQNVRQGMDQLRQNKSLIHLERVFWQKTTPAEFWKWYDAEIGKK